MAKKTSKPTKTTKKTEKANKSKTKSSKKKSRSYDEDDDMGADVKSQAHKNKNKFGSSIFNLPENTELFVPKANKTYKLDHLPYRITDKNHPSGRAKGKLWYERTYYRHFNVGPDDQQVICPKSIGKPCPVCEYYRSLLKSGDEDDESTADKIKRKERQLFNVINLDDQDKGVQLFDISVFNYGNILDEEIRESEEDSGYSRFAQLKGGSTLKVRFKEASMGTTKFPQASRIDFKEREDYDKDILDDVINLDEILIVKSYEELEALIHGSPDDDDDDDEAPKKGKKNKKSSGKKSSKKKKDEDEDEDDFVDDEDEEEEDEDEDEDEEEDEEDVDEDDEEEDEDEDEDEDEEDDEEETKKSSKKKSSKKKASPKSKKKSNPKSKSKSGKKKKCPAGGTFGEDCDDYDECADCSKWVECSELSDS